MINIFVFRCVNLDASDYHYFYFADQQNQNNSANFPYNKLLSWLRLIETVIMVFPKLLQQCLDKWCVKLKCWKNLSLLFNKVDNFPSDVNIIPERLINSSTMVFINCKSEKNLLLESLLLSFIWILALCPKTFTMRNILFN